MCVCVGGGGGGGGGEGEGGNEREGLACVIIWISYWGTFSPYHEDTLEWAEYRDSHIRIRGSSGERRET